MLGTDSLREQMKLRQYFVHEVNETACREFEVEEWTALAFGCSR